MKLNLGTTSTEHYGNNSFHRLASTLTRQGERTDTAEDLEKHLRDVISESGCIQRVKFYAYGNNTAINIFPKGQRNKKDEKKTVSIRNCGSTIRRQSTYRGSHQQEPRLTIH